VVPGPRGLAAGLTAAGFGAGSALTDRPDLRLHQVDGYEAAFLYFGIGQGSSCSCLAGPDARARAEVPHPRQACSRASVDYTPTEVLRTPVFWVMYAMFVDGGRGRPDGDRAARPDRQGLQDRDSPVNLMGLVAAAPDLRAARSTACSTA
jgi:OFA family oxalate/formate antiporter-like MFS transporter